MPTVNINIDLSDVAGRIAELIDEIVRFLQIGLVDHHH